MVELRPSWRTDPTGVFDQRYWDGTRWTDRVEVDGVRGVSPVHADRGRAREIAGAIAAGEAHGRWRGSVRTSMAEVDGQPYHVVVPTAPATAQPRWAPQLLLELERPRAGRATEVDNRWLLALLLVPGVTAAVEVAIGTGATADLLVPLALATVVWSVVFVLLDLRANPRLAARSTRARLVLLAAVFAPAYVWRRQRSLGGPLLPFWLHLVVLALAVVFALASGIATVSTTSQLEARLTDEIQATLGLAATVECPRAISTGQGTTTTCAVTTGDRSGMVHVQVVDAAGALAWDLAE